MIANGDVSAAKTIISLVPRFKLFVAVYGLLLVYLQHSCIGTELNYLHWLPFSTAIRLVGIKSMCLEIIPDESERLAGKGPISPGRVQGRLPAMLKIRQLEEAQAQNN